MDLCRGGEIVASAASDIPMCRTLPASIQLRHGPDWSSSDRRLRDLDPVLIVEEGRSLPPPRAAETGVAALANVLGIAANAKRTRRFGPRTLANLVASTTPSAAAASCLANQCFVASHAVHVGRVEKIAAGVEE